MTEQLTPREFQIMRMAADGLEYKQIAHIFGTSFSTVKNQAWEALGKLGAHNKCHAVNILFGGKNVMDYCVYADNCNRHTSHLLSS